jgi:uncharacterized protein (TIGR03437 family)
VRGDQDSQSDLAFQRLRDELIRQDRVAPSSIFTIDGPANTILPATPAGLNSLIARAQSSSCKKLYLFVDSGANIDNPGLLLKGDPNITGGLPASYSYETLVRQLTALEGIEVQGIFAVPYGTTVATIFMGWGIRGELVTSTSDQKYGARSAFLNEVSTAFASSNGDLKAVHAALARSLDPEISNAQPTVVDILPSADRFLDLPYTFLDVPGSSVVSVSRPPGAGSRIPFDIRLTSSNPSIGTYTPADLSIPVNKIWLLTPVLGQANGVTSIAGTARNDGFTYVGRGAIQVGRFKVNPNPCLTIAGGQCNITIERLSRNLSVLPQEFILSLGDATIASLPQSQVRFEAGETTKTFVISAIKTGITNLSLSASLYFEAEVSIPVIIEDPPSNAGPSPISCTFLASPTTLAASASGGIVSFEIRAANTCVWAASTSADWLTLPPPVSGAGAARIFVQIAPNLSSATRTATVLVSGQTITITQTGLANTAPAITSVSNGASFNSTISPGSWVTISGSNLASTTRIWAGTDFPGGTKLPVSLDSTSVTIGGIPAYVYFISPTQLNVLAPDGLLGNRVEVQVRRGDLESNRFLADILPLAPAFFLFSPENRAYPAAVHPDGVFAARPGLYPGLSLRAAAPGDIIQLYLTGLGETNPATPSSQTFGTPAPTTLKPVVEVGGINADVLFSGKVSGGLYQLNIRVPRLPSGDHPLRVWLNGQPSGQNIFLTLQ